MTTLTDSMTARAGTEEANDGGRKNTARRPGDSSGSHQSGGGLGISTGQTVRPEAEAEGMGCTPLSTPGPRPARAEQRISALTRRSTVAKGTCDTCPGSRPMTDAELKTYPGWTRICETRGCGVCDNDGCAKHHASHQLDGLVKRAAINDDGRKHLRLVFTGLCPECGKNCGNDGLMVMHYRWKHNKGVKITAADIRDKYGKEASR